MRVTLRTLCEGEPREVRVFDSVRAAIAEAEMYTVPAGYSVDVLVSDDTGMCAEQVYRRPARHHAWMLTPDGVPA